MKKIALLIASVIVLLGVSSSKIVKAYDNVQNKKIEFLVQANNIEIQKTLYGYLSNKWEEEKEAKVIKNEYIVVDSLQMSYDNLKSEYNHRWCEEIGEKIKWYKMNVNVNSVELVNGLIKVDVDNYVPFQYEDVKVTSSIKEHHLIYLREKNGNVLVERDVYNDLLSKDEGLINGERDFSKNYEFNKYINEKIEKVTSDLDTVSDDINHYKSDMKKNVQVNQRNLSITTRAYSRYNGFAAASWAINHVYDEEVWPSHDCTYFVSSALNAGGLPTDETWYKDKYCVAWVKVIDLRNWLVNKGYVRENVGIAYGSEGDVIQFFSSGEQRWIYSVIVTYTNHRYGNCYVSAHSNAARNVSIRNYYQSSTYSNARTLQLL